MKRVLLCMVTAVFYGQITACPTSKLFDGPVIRVLLQELKTNKRATFTLKSESGFLLSKTVQPNVTTTIGAKQLTVTVYKNKITLKDSDKTNPHAVEHQLRQSTLAVASADEMISVNGTTYTGFILFDMSKTGVCKLINWVNLEDYVYAVLRHESYQTWPDAMQEVQAIACRTYAAYCMDAAHKQNEQIDIQRTNFHQVYNGTHKYEHLRNAVKKTNGAVLCYKDKLALTMYDACCGGCLPSKIDGFDFSNKPYLCRNYPCNYCRRYSLYRWQHRFNLQDIADRLRSNPTTMSSVSKIGKIRKICAIKSSIDGAGVGHKILITGTKGKTTISGSQFYGIVRHKARSRSYSISMDGFGIKLKGRGFGHLVGMCQRGARELVNRGWNIKRILSFYYPGTILKHLEQLPGFFIKRT